MNPFWKSQQERRWDHVRSLRNGRTSWDEIAALYGLTRGRIKQIHREALRERRSAAAEDFITRADYADRLVLDAWTLRSSHARSALDAIAD